ncbi:hypothetical protein GS445_28570 [Rhodococcus hoagii]|nr:hypothetical protein [Prescottella equi]
MHSADSGWLACQVAPQRGNRTQVWVVRTDPLDRSARASGRGTLSLPNHRVGREPGRAHRDRRGRRRGARLVDPQTQEAVTLDRRVGSFLVDSWAERTVAGGASRTPRTAAQRDDGTRIPLLPSDSDPPPTWASCSTTTDCSAYSAVRSPWASSEGEPDQYIGRWCAATTARSSRGCWGSRSPAEGVSYRVLAERDYCGLDEFVVSDDHTTVAWAVELQGAE